jgi:hypothetical protein
MKTDDTPQATPITLRDYIVNQPRMPLPRPFVLRDQFFNRGITEILNTTDVELAKDMKFIHQLGTKGEAALSKVIRKLRREMK